MPDFNVGVFVLVALLIIAILVIIANIKVVPQANRLPRPYQPYHHNGYAEK